MAGINRPRDKKISYDKKYLNTLYYLFSCSLLLFALVAFFNNRIFDYSKTEKFLLVEVKRFGLPGELREYRDELRSKEKLVFVFEGKQGVDIYDYFLSNGIDLEWIVQEKTKKLQMQKKNTTLVLQRLEQDNYKLEMIQKKNGHNFLLAE